MKDEYRHELYARGFVLKPDRPPSVPKSWRRMNVAGRHLAHDPRLRCVVGESGTAGMVVCLGHISDLRDPGLSPQGCADRLAAALASSVEAFHEDLAWTGGCYVLFCFQPGNVFALTDCASSRRLFHHAQSSTVASHVPLISRNAPDHRRRRMIIPARGAPGRLTPIEDAYLLTPNTLLDLDSFEVRRYWPIMSVPPRETAEAALQVGALMSASLENAQIFFEPHVSLTAGLDSRVTAALCRHRPQLEFFNYFRSDNIDTDDNDRRFVHQFELLSDHKVHFHNILSSKDIPSAFTDVLSRNTLARHMWRVVWFYYNQYRDRPNSVHVRSNLAEVGRDILDDGWVDLRTPLDMAEIYLGPHKRYQSKEMAETVRIFEEFCHAVGFFDAAEIVSPYSLMHWEFRLPSWFGNAVAECDVAIETISPYNCRRIYEAMLGVPKKDRLDGMVQRRIIAKFWPELTRFEVNQKPFWPQGVPEDLKDILSD